MNQIREELDRNKLGVIAKVDFSEWVTPTFYVKKNNNKLWIYVNFSKGLKKCVKTYTYPLPNPGGNFAKLNGRKFFLKWDLLETYLQLQIEEKCSKLLTTNTHKSLYIFNWLPFRIKVAPCIFAAGDRHNACRYEFHYSISGWHSHKRSRGQHKRKMQIFHVRKFGYW